MDIDDWSLWLDDEGSAESEIESKKFARKSSCRMFYNGDIEELLDSFHCIRRLGRACFSEAHSAYLRFLSLLANAFFIVDATDLEALKHARRHLGWTREPSKKEVRRHCRTLIPPPAELEKRVQAVLKAFLFVKDSRGVRLYTPRMLYEWQLQRMHIRRGCLSDPGSVPLYRLVGHEHLGGVKSSETKLCVWQSLRGSSELEGFHPHQSRWVTGSRVGPDLFQAQSFLGLIHWNLRRAAEHRNLNLPTVFDPLLTASINKATTEEYGIAKYPDFKCNMSDTGELFGIDYKQEAAKDQQPQATVEKESDVLSDKEEDDTILEVDASVQNELAQMMDESRKSKATSSGGKLVLREKLEEPSVCIHPSIDTDSPEESGMTEPLDGFTDMELPSIKTPSFLPISQQNLKPVPRLRPLFSPSRRNLKETTESSKSGMEKPTKNHSQSDAKPNCFIKGKARQISKCGKGISEHSLCKCR